MKRFLIVLITIFVLCAFLPINAMAANTAYAQTSEPLTSGQEETGFRRGIVLVAPDNLYEWEFITEDTTQTQTTRKFKLNDAGDLLYTPVENNRELDAKKVYLEPRDKPLKFERGDIFIYVIDENGQKQSVHCRLNGEGKLPVNIIPMEAAKLPYGVFIDERFFALDSYAMSNALKNLDEQESKAKEEEARLREEKEKEEQKQKYQEAIKEVLYGAIQWEKLDDSSDKPINLLIAVELSKEENDLDGETVWRVVGKETSQISAYASIVTWVLCGAVFASLIMIAMLLFLRRK